jgi:methionyl aminopeptidase
VTLSDVTQRALMAGIEAARPGQRIGDVAAAIGAIGRGAGYGIPEGWGGHGVGRKMHEDPSVPNEGQAGRGLRIKPGLVIAIEPMFHAGGDDGFRIDDDGWTIRTADGSRAGHWEHTIAVTADGPVILTAP